MLENVAWFMKYKPKSIEEYIFSNAEQEELVKKWLENGEIDGNLLLYGPPGQGKTSLASILIKNLIKTDYDLKKITSRSVSDIDELKSWCLSVPLKSKKKIVYIEEFDKLSNVALSTLKDGLLENFQTHISFICTTNHIHFIEPALISRFNYRFLLSPNPEKYYERLVYILEQEGVNYNPNQLKSFVEDNYEVGLRELISKINVGSKNKILVLDDDLIFSYEDEIVKLYFDIISKVISETDSSKRKIIMVDILNSIISSEYQIIIERIKSNPDLNWEEVFVKIEDKVYYLPIKFLVNKYFHDLSTKRMPHLVFLAFLYESIKTICEIW